MAQLTEDETGDEEMLEFLAARHAASTTERSSERNALLGSPVLGRARLNTIRDA